MNDNIYTRLGVRPIINAYAPITRLGGGVMSREVADAMREAGCVAVFGRMDEVARFLGA